MTDTLKMPQGSIEYLYVDITGDVTLDQQPVSIAVTGGDPASGDWKTAEWVGTAGTTRSARLLLDGTLTVGTYEVWAKVQDNPEVPIMNTGKLRIS